MHLKEIKENVADSFDRVFVFHQLWCLQEYWNPIDITINDIKIYLSSSSRDN